MAITVYLRPEHETQVRTEADARGISVSALVQEALGLRDTPNTRLDDLDKRVARLEELAHWS